MDQGSRQGRAQPAADAAERPPRRSAQEDLDYIRRMLAASGHLSIVPGRGIAVIGALALAVTAVNRWGTGPPWREDAVNPASLGLWGALLAVSLAIGAGAMAQKARRTGQVFWSPVLRKALWGYGAAMTLGAILTASVIYEGRADLLAEVWLGCYGAGLTAAGVVSVAPVRWMGVCFLTLAAAAAVAPPWAGLLLLGLGFGWAHLSFGAYIAWRHDG
jgi:hypothetical protein